MKPDKTQVQDLLIRKQSLVYDPPSLKSIPITYQDVYDYLGQFQNINPFLLRLETIKRIEEATSRPLICYLAKTHHVPSDIKAQTSIDDSDVTGFTDLIHGIEGEKLDVLLVSNGGSAEATERIVNLLRSRFSDIRFIIPGNAYSAATLIALSGNKIVMSSSSTLGPIDPQIDGIPARTIIRGFENVQKELMDLGPQALTAYMPLLEKYSLHLLEICRSAEKLSKELAQSWLNLFHGLDSAKSKEATEFFADFDMHHSHRRTINREAARERGLNVIDLEDNRLMSDLVSSLYNQYLIWFDRTPWFKVFENSHGIGWGRQAQQAQQIQIQLPMPTFVPPNVTPQGQIQ